MNDRREKILAEIEEMFPLQFEKSSTETVQFCEKESSRIVEGFLNTLSKVTDYVCQKEEINNDETQYLLFSCLHSSIALRKYLIRIDLMGKNFYNSEPLATSYWDAGDIYQLFEEDISAFRHGMVGKVPRLKEYEMDYVRYAYAPYYHRMAKMFIVEMLEVMLEEIKTDRQEGHEAHTVQDDDKHAAQIKIMFGEHMGEADKLFTIEKEQFYEVFQDLCR